jgi:hypothetical protein
MPAADTIGELFLVGDYNRAEGSRHRSAVAPATIVIDGLEAVLAWTNRHTHGGQCGRKAIAGQDNMARTGCQGGHRLSIGQNR